MATTPNRTGWRSSRPTGATWPACRKITGALHWAQLRIYGWLLCKQKSLSGVKLALVYFDVGSERETVFDEEQSAAELEQHFATHCASFVSWAESETAHPAVARRGATRASLSLRGLSRWTARVITRGLQADTNGWGAVGASTYGIGKTVGTLFPALKAMGTQAAAGDRGTARDPGAARDPGSARDPGAARDPSAARDPGAHPPLDKVFYLVAKTSGRQLALDALRRFQPADSTLPLRVVELVARGKSCENPGLPCDGAVCPLARGFYDRLPAARAEAIDISFLDQEAVRQVARRHQICPYYLSQELARWSDVVVGDYNYYFDRSAMLFGWTVTHEWRVCLLVDEAHNLVERARHHVHSLRSTLRRSTRSASAPLTR